MEVQAHLKTWISFTDIVITIPRGQYTMKMRCFDRFSQENIWHRGI